MLLYLDTPVKAVCGVVCEYGDRSLGEDWTGIYAGVDDVHGASADTHTPVERFLRRAVSRKRRKQGRVYVDDPAGKAFEKRWPEHAHEPRQDDQVRPEIGDLGRKRFVPRVTVITFALGNHTGGDSTPIREFQRGGRASIRNHAVDDGIAGACVDRITDRPQVGAAARDENDYIHLGL